MILVRGQILRFKGRNAQTHCDDVERELHGSCRRDGNTIEITKNVKLKADHDPAPFEIFEPAPANRVIDLAGHRGMNCE